MNGKDGKGKAYPLSSKHRSKATKLHQRQQADEKIFRLKTDFTQGIVERVFTPSTFLPNNL